jgi:hypothetical protein
MNGRAYQAVGRCWSSLCCGPLLVRAEGSSCFRMLGIDAWLHKNEPSGSMARDVACSLVTQHRTSGPSKPWNSEALQQPQALSPRPLAMHLRTKVRGTTRAPRPEFDSIFDCGCSFARGLGNRGLGNRCASRTTARWIHILPEVEVLEQSTQRHPTLPYPIRRSHGTLTNRVV